MTSTIGRSATCLNNEDDLADGKSVLSKARLILEAFGHDDYELSLAELCRRTAMAKATAHRLCGELVHWGWLERTANNYRLGLVLFQVGQLVPRHRILRDAALPYMEDIFLATQETVHLAIRDGLSVLYIEKIGGHRQVDGPSHVGMRLPLHATSTGKVILAYSPPEIMREVVYSGPAQLTRKTTVGPHRLARQVADVRSQGFAVESEEVRLGHMSVAVPLFGRLGMLLGAMSVTLPAYRASVPRLTGMLRTASIGVSRALGSVELPHEILAGPA